LNVKLGRDIVITCKKIFVEIRMTEKIKWDFFIERTIFEVKMTETE
jgi:hypothetical protein